MLAKMVRMGVRRGSAPELVAESWSLQELEHHFPCWVVLCVYEVPLQIQGEEAKLRLQFIWHKWDLRVFSRRVQCASNLEGP